MIPAPRARLQELEQTWRDNAKLEYKAANTHPARSKFRANILNHADAQIVCADQLAACLAAEGEEEPTREAQRLDAVVTAFEELQLRGYCLADATGELLRRQAYEHAMVIACDAALRPKTLPPVASPASPEGE